MEIRVDLDQWGDWHRASSWVLGRWHTAIGASPELAQDKLIAKLRDQSKVQGIKAGAIESRVVQI